MTEKTKMKLYVLYALAIGVSLNLVFVLMFYQMLFNGNAIITVDANSFGEYWIEFFLLQFCLILTVFTLINETKRYYKR